VPLDDVWVKPAERAWLIDKRHAEETEDLRIGARKEQPFLPADVEKELKLKRAEEELAERVRPRLDFGQSLLSRYGYYLPNDDGFYIGSGRAPYYADGVGLSYGDASVFSGTLGAGCFPYDDGYSRYGGFRNYPGYASYGFSPGILYRSRHFNFGFGSGLSDCGYYGSSYSGFGFSFSGGSNRFRFRGRFGGF